jgi:bHLH factor
LQKEVERRRRGNINEGINELGRIVPNGSGEKAKGAILSRAVQYIHHLKENEARNIEKWTLEKLLMDQAMGDLQAQLEEMRRLWEEERTARQRLESDLDMLRDGSGKTSHVRSRSPAGGHSDQDEEEEEVRGGKRQRVE